MNEGSVTREGFFKDVRFCASVMVTKEKADLCKFNVKAQAMSELRIKLADAIIEKKATETSTPFHIEYTVDLYVFSPEELRQLIDREYVDAKRVELLWGCHKDGGMTQER